MESLKEKIPMFIMVLVAVAICGLTIYFIEFKSFTYYTQIDNTKIEQVSVTDDMKYQYTLDCYNEKGKKKEFTFKTSRELREDAYLKLKVLAITGVNNWEEVQFDELIEDINLDDNKFTIIGKGNKERTNYLNKKTKDALIKYLKIRDNSHDNNKKHNNALFLTFYGYRMSQFTINKIVKRAYRKAELDENVYTVHTLRHTCATLLYRSGVNIKTIQELLGHVHIDTTEIYTHLDNQEVKDVMFEHPLAQFKMEDALAYCA